MAKHHLTGACLCGHVTLKADVDEAVFDACHCGMCRRWSGGPVMTVHAKNGVSFSGDDAIGVFGSSEWAERGFCKNCGTHLFYRLKGRDDHFLPFGLLTGAENFTFQMQIFVDRKPACYAFANQTETMTEAEVFAKYAS